MDNTMRNDEDFWDDLAGLVDGEKELLQKHADLLSESDEHRDARFEAERITNLVGDAGLDYEVPADLESKLLSALDKRGPVTFTPVAEQGSVGASAAGVAQPAQEGQRVSGPFPTNAGNPQAAGTPQAAGNLGHAATQPSMPAPQVLNQPASTGSAPAGAQAPSGSAPVAASKPKSSGAGKVIALFGTLAAAALVLLVAAGLVWKFAFGAEEDAVAALSAQALGGTITQISRASADGAQGVSIRLANATEFAAATSGAEVQAGSTVRTDERTRLIMELSDGSTLTVNHNSEVTFDAERPRTLTLTRGDLVAEVAHLENGPHAFYRTPTGVVEVLGTKFVLSATEETASVRVTRGSVRVESVGTVGSTAEVKTGQEGLMPKAGAISVGPVTNLAQELAWSELGTTENSTEPTISGVGELRASRPGEREETERPLTLAHHRSTVRIVGNVARTEIEETFQNDSEHTLEGIYKFPLPADARIASLQLEVDGVWEQGAFIERNRAQRIWRGVIRNATPQAQRVQNEEFIWVPGPWRDPALLEWQRGGKFELRIFPIAARSSRRIRIAYTQNIAPNGLQGRRYVHPLPQSADESTRIGRFEVDVRVAGNEGEVAASGYEMAKTTDGDATQLRFASENFLPNGDLIVDYQLPNPDGEVRFWTFAGDATAPVPEDTRERNNVVNDAQRVLNNDGRGYAVFAIRPDLPGWTESAERDYVFVVDSSQSMVGERFERASTLVSRIIGEMDRRDRFMVLTCDATCRSMTPDPAHPSGQMAGQVQSWLGTVEPAGSSDLTYAMGQAVESLEGKRQADRDVRVIYVGDGIASVGHRRAASIREEVDAMAEDDAQVSYSAVGIGGDSDTTILQTVARAGRGHYVPYVPGQTMAGAALAVLQTTYGVSLTNAHVVLPDGVEDIAPTQLPTIRMGEEVLVVGRLTGETIQGNVELSGKVAGQVFEQRYPVTVTTSRSLGNAFVPRQWAAARIGDLESEGRGEDEANIVALSKAFGVMSRYTSLLVLESEAMFRAFGVDRAQPTVQWTGEEDAEMGEANGALSAQLGGLGYAGGDLDDNVSGLLGTTGTGRGGGGFGSGAMGTRGSERRRARRPSSMRTPTVARPRFFEEAQAPQPTPQARRAEPEREAAPARDGEVSAADSADAAAANVQVQGQPVVQPRMPQGGQWMRREWFRTGAISPTSDVGARSRTRTATAESALRESPDSRDRHRELVRALSRSGDLTRAMEVAEAWIERDQLDPEALIYKADLLGRMGNQEEAIRVLSGVVDLQPDEQALQDRLADSLERAGMAERACAHRIALSELHASALTNGGDTRRRRRQTNASVAAVAQALKCVRGLGNTAAADRLLRALPSDEVRTQAEAAANELSSASRLRGDLMLDATWSGGTDLDLSIIRSDGTRLSWMGGHRNVVGEQSRASGAEKLGLRWTPVGSYIIEVSRADSTDTTPVTGTINVRMLGERQALPFTLTGDRMVVGQTTVRRESRMVNVQGRGIW